MGTVNYKQVACYLTSDQHDDLKRLSAKTLIPVQRILRQAVDRILADYKARPRNLGASVNSRLTRLRTRRARK